MSIGAFEHFGHDRYGRFFEMAHQVMPDDGIMLLHTITRADPVEREGLNLPVTMSLMRFTKFIGDEIFPGGQIPVIAEVEKFSTEAGFTIYRIHKLREHYAKTLDVWSATLEAKHDEAVDHPQHVDYRRVEGGDLLGPHVVRVVRRWQVQPRMVIGLASDVERLEEVGRADQTETVRQDLRLRWGVAAVDLRWAPIGCLGVAVQAEERVGCFGERGERGERGGEMPWPTICMNPTVRAAASTSAATRSRWAAVALASRDGLMSIVGTVSRPSTVWTDDRGPFYTARAARATAAPGDKIVALQIRQKMSRSKLIPR